MFMNSLRLWSVRGLSAKLDIQFVSELRLLPAANCNFVGKFVGISDLCFSVAHKLLDQWGGVKDNTHSESEFRFYHIQIIACTGDGTNIQLFEREPSHTNV